MGVIARGDIQNFHPGYGLENNVGVVITTRASGSKCGHDETKIAILGMNFEPSRIYGVGEIVSPQDATITVRDRFVVLNRAYVMDGRWIRTHCQ